MAYQIPPPPEGRFGKWAYQMWDYIAKNRGGYAGNLVGSNPITVGTGTTGTFTLGHDTSGVGAGTFGTGLTWPRFSVDARGHLVTATAGGTLGTFASFASLVGAGDLLGTTTTNTFTGALSTTGVVAGTYGNGTSVSQVTVDAKGRLTAATGVSISFPTPRALEATAPVAIATAAGTYTVSHNTSGVGAGTYGGTLGSPSLVVDARGHLTSGTSVQLPAARVSVPYLGSATYQDADDMLRFVATAGLIMGGTLAAAGTAAFTVGTGQGAIRTSNSITAEITFFDFPALSTTAIPVNAVRYVGVEYNAGTPQVVVHTVDDWNYYSDFPVGMVANQGNVIHVNQDGRLLPDQVGRLIRRFYGTLPYARDERQGGLVLGEGGTRNFTLSAGTLWDRSVDFTIAALNTAVAGSFDAYYRDGVGGWTGDLARTQWPNTQYDDGSGTLATLLNNNRWAVLWFYLETDGQVVMLYGQAEYTTQAAAAAEGSPSTVPARITASGRILGRFIFQKSATTAHSIESVWNVEFTAAGVSEHGNLAGLADDDHTQYHTDARALTWATTNLVGTAPIVVSTVGTTGLIWSHSTSGVTAGTYGNGTAVSRVTVDALGHLAAVSAVDIAFPSPRALEGAAPIAIATAAGTYTVSHDTSGASAGTYGAAMVTAQLVVDALGHVTSAANSGTLGTFAGFNSLAAAGYITGTTTTGTLTAAYAGTLVGAGDVLGTSTTGTFTGALSTTGVAAGTYGAASLAAQLVVDAKGRLTSATTVAIAASLPDNLIAASGTVGSNKSYIVGHRLEISSGINWEIGSAGIAMIL